MGLHRCVAHGERLLVPLSRGVGVAGLLQREPEIVQKLRVARMMGERVLVNADRFGRLAALARRVAEVEHRLRIRRVERERRTPGGLGGGDIARRAARGGARFDSDAFGREERAAQQCPCACVVRRKRQRAARTLLRFGVTTFAEEGSRASRVERSVIGQDRDCTVARVDRFGILSACERNERQHVRRVGMPRIGRLHRARGALGGRQIGPAYGRRAPVRSARADRISRRSRDPPGRARRGTPCSGGRCRRGTEHCAMPVASSSLHFVFSPRSNRSPPRGSA